MEFKNNSEEMKTIVETFVIEETADLIYDNDKLEKWNKIVSELDLKGQEKIIKPEKSPIPFMYINEQMKEVFQTLCPRKVDVSEYDKTPIPLDILELVSLSKKEEYFNEIQIWYDDKSPDPFCIGMTCKYYGYVKGQRTTDFISEEKLKLAGAESTYQTNLNFYLLGKWADVKRSFDELKEMAVQRYINENRASYLDTIKTYETYLSNLESDALRRFS